MSALEPMIYNMEKELFFSYGLPWLFIFGIFFGLIYVSLRKKKIFDKDFMNFFVAILLAIIIAFFLLSLINL